MLLSDSLLVVDVADEMEVLVQEDDNDEGDAPDADVDVEADEDAAVVGKMIELSDGCMRWNRARFAFKAAIIN